jgi:hypothetical protein
MNLRPQRRYHRGSGQTFTCSPGTSLKGLPHQCNWSRRTSVCSLCLVFFVCFVYARFPRDSGSGGCLPTLSVGLSFPSAERASPRSESWKTEPLPPCLRRAGRGHSRPPLPAIGRRERRLQDLGNWSRGVAAFLSASSLRRLIFRRIWPPGDACPLPRSASAALRPRGLPPGPNPGKSKRLRQAAPRKRRYPVITYGSSPSLS